MLNDAQLAYTDLLTFFTRTFKGVKIEYTIKRGDQIEMGDIYLSFNRYSKIAKIVTISHFDDTGVRFCARLDDEPGLREEGLVRLLYTSTVTGIIPIFKHQIINFTL